MADFENEDNAEVVEDTLRVKLSFPTPTDHEVIARRLEENAIQGNQGKTKTIMMTHEGSGMEGYAEKAGLLSNWVLTITGPDGDEKDIDGRKDISWIKDRDGLHEAASRLATRIVGPSKMVAEIVEHKLSEADVLHVEVGETSRVISGNKLPKDSDRMIVEAELSMPREFSDIADFHADNARRDYTNNIVRVGDHVTGIIRAAMQDDGSWIARGQGEVDYERVFDSGDGMDLDSVTLEIAEDMASFELSDRAIINHVRREGSYAENITSVTLNGETHYIEPDEGNEPG